MPLDWVEIDRFSNTADSVNTSLGVHLFENLQALNVGSKTFKCLPVLYRLCPSYWTKSSRFSLSTAFFFFLHFLSNSKHVNQPFISVSLSIFLSRSYSKPRLLVDGRLNVTVVKWEKKRRIPAWERSVPWHRTCTCCATSQSFVRGWLSLALQDKQWRRGKGQEERCEL